MSEFCNCGSLVLGGKCSNQHCPEKKIKRRGWAINGMFFAFGVPVTYAEAAISAERIKVLQSEIRRELRR